MGMDDNNDLDERTCPMAGFDYLDNKVEGLSLYKNQDALVKRIGKTLRKIFPITVNKRLYKHFNFKMAAIYGDAAV